MLEIAYLHIHLESFVKALLRYEWDEGVGRVRSRKESEVRRIKQEQACRARENEDDGV